MIDTTKDCYLNFNVASDEPLQVRLPTFWERIRSMARDIRRLERPRWHFYIIKDWGNDRSANQ